MTMDISARVRLDGSQAAAGAREVASAIGEIAPAATSTVAPTKAAAEANKEMARQQAANAKEVQKLKELLDPTIRAQREFTEQTKLAEVALRQGAITTAQYEKRIKDLATAQKAGASASAAHKAGVQQLGFQLGDFSTQVIGGTNPIIAFAQQAGQAAGALSLMGGTAGTVGTFLSGPFGAIILATVSVVALLGAEFLRTSEATSKASVTADDFASRQDNLANFIDKTTGALIEQNRALLANAIARRQDTIDANNKRSEDLAGDAIGAIRKQAFGFKSSGLGFRTNIDPTLQKALNVGDIEQIDATVQGLARLNPKYKDLARQTGEAAAQTVLLRRKSAELGGEVDKLTGKTAAQGTVTTSLIAKQVALIAATTPLEKAQARRAIVQEGAADADRKGGAALVKFRADLLEAERGVNAAQAAVESARAGKAASRKATVEMGKAERAAEAESRKLEATLTRIVGKFAPAADAARDYATALSDIAKLRAADKITFGEQVQFDAAAKGAFDKASAEQAAAALKDAIRRANPGETLEQSGEEFRRSVDAAADRLQEAARAARHELTDGLDELAQIIGGLFPGGVGGKVGQTINAGKGLFDLLGKRDGNLAKLDTSLQKISKGVGLSDGAAAKIGNIGGKAIQGAAEGALTNSVFAPIAKGLGLKTSKTGAQIGGAIGSALPIPGGAQIGAILGSITGGLLKKASVGKVTLTSATSALNATGNSGSAKAAATEIGGSIQSGLQQIADQLGGGLGSFNVTVGQRNGDYRVTTGTSLKVKKGAKDFDDDAAGANAYAIGIALTQGAVTGLSGAVSKALQSSTDVGKALSEALKVKDLESFIATAADALKEQFASFDRVAKARVDLARQYGVDVIAVEGANAKARSKLVEETLRASVGSLQTLLSDITAGDLFEGSGADKRAALLSEINATRAKVAANEDGATDTLAQLYRTLLGGTRDAFGTAGSEYASDRATVTSGASAVIAAEQKRIADAAAQQAAAQAALEGINAGTSETNDLLAISNARLVEIAGGITNLSSYLAGIGITPGYVGRSVELA